MSYLERADAKRVVGEGRWLATGSPGIRRCVLAAAALVKVPRGTRIYDARGGPAGLVGIADGHVRLEIVSGPEDPGLFAIATPGFVLADMPPPEGLASAVSATAGKDCTLLTLAPRRLAALALSTPGLDAAIARLLTINFRATLSIVSALRRQSTIGRVAALLVALAGADPADGWRVEVPQADLAAMAAIGRTALIEALRDLEERGLIETGYRVIRLRQVAGLLALCDGTADAPGTPGERRSRSAFDGLGAAAARGRRAPWG